MSTITPGSIMVFDIDRFWESAGESSPSSEGERKFVAKFRDKATKIPVRIVEKQSGFQNTYYQVYAMASDNTISSHKFITSHFLTDGAASLFPESQLRILRNYSEFDVVPGTTHTTTRLKLTGEDKTMTTATKTDELIDQMKGSLNLGVRLKGGKVVTNLAKDLINKNNNIPFMVKAVTNSKFGDAAVALGLSAVLKYAPLKDNRVAALQDCIAAYSGVSLVDTIPVEEWISSLFSALPTELRNNPAYNNTYGTFNTAPMHPANNDNAE